MNIRNARVSRRSILLNNVRYSYSLTKAQGSIQANASTLPTNVFVSERLVEISF